MNAKRDLLRTLLALGLGAAGLSGCGGAREDDEDDLVETELRLVNASTTLSTADLFLDEDRIVSDVALDEASRYRGVDNGSATLKVATGGTSVGLATVEQSLARQTAYTAVAWGRGGSIKLTVLTDDEDAPDDDGNGKLRLFNAAPDAGTLDLYLTEADTAIDDSSPVASVAGGIVGSWNELGARSYRLRVTAAGDPTDLRLDVGSFSIGRRERVTLVLQPGPGGVLVHALKVVQRGSVTAFKNESARLRLVASVASQGRVSLAVGGSTLFNGLASPGISAYVLIPASTTAAEVSVGAAALSAPALALEAGGDYTLMAYGAAGAAQVVSITDDNRLPTVSSRAKLRLVNGVSTQPSVELTLDAATVAGSIVPGAASSYQQVDANAEATLQVFGAGSDPIFDTGDNPIPIVAAAVYTFFLLDGAVAPADRLRRDR